jgi:hypothetical protein
MPTHPGHRCCYKTETLPRGGAGGAARTQRRSRSIAIHGRVSIFSHLSLDELLRLRQSKLLNVEPILSQKLKEFCTNLKTRNSTIEEIVRDKKKWILLHHAERCLPSSKFNFIVAKYAIRYKHYNLLKKISFTASQLAKLLTTTKTDDAAADIILQKMSTMEVPPATWYDVAKFAADRTRPNIARVAIPHLPKKYIRWLLLRLVSRDDIGGRERHHKRAEIARMLLPALSPRDIAKALSRHPGPLVVDVLTRR